MFHWFGVVISLISADYRPIRASNCRSGQICSTEFHMASCWHERRNFDDLRLQLRPTALWMHTRRNGNCEMRMAGAGWQQTPNLDCMLRRRIARLGCKERRSCVCKSLWKFITFVWFSSNTAEARFSTSWRLRSKATHSCLRLALKASSECSITKRLCKTPTRHKSLLI